MTVEPGDVVDEDVGWMVDHIGTATAFVVLGIVIPVVLLVIIVVTARRLAAD